MRLPQKKTAQGHSLWSKTHTHTHKYEYTHKRMEWIKDFSTKVIMGGCSTRYISLSPSCWKHSSIRGSGKTSDMLQKLYMPRVYWNTLHSAYKISHKLSSHVSIFFSYILDPYLHRPSVWSPDAQQSVTVSGQNSTGLQGFGLNGAAVHMEGGGSLLYAQGHLVPTQVHQSLHPLTGENAAHQISFGVFPPGTQGQGAIVAVEVYRELGSRAEMWGFGKRGEWRVRRWDGWEKSDIWIYTCAS